MMIIDEERDERQPDLLKDQERDGRVLQVRDLRKTFANGLSAVKGLNVKMYSG